MLLGAVAQAQNFAITATTEAAVRKNIVKGNAANYGFGVINDTLKLIGLTTKNVIFTGTIGKSGVGLGNVDNTSDANKPPSTATQTALNLKQNQLNGTGFVKASGTTISYDNSTYLTTSSATSTYLPINNPTATGTLTAPTISNSLGANFATTSGNVGIGTTSPTSKLHISGAGDNTIKINSTATNNAYLNLTLQNTGSIPYGILEAGDGVAYRSLVLNPTSGNVGIGTYPSYKLHVTGGNIYVGGVGAGVRMEDRSISSRSYQLYVDGGALAVFNHNNSTQPLTVTDGGNVLVGTVTNSGFKLDVNGTARATQLYLSALNTAPASATATGTTGEIRIDASYIYICTATNVWKRSAITTW